MTAQEAREKTKAQISILQDAELKAVLYVVEINAGLGIFSIETDKLRFWNLTKSKLEELDYVVAADDGKLKISW